VVNEALGAGLPIIVSDRVGARDLVEDGCNGFVTPAGDIDALARALLSLGRSRDLRESFGRSSAERAIHWDVDEGVRRWIELSNACSARQEDLQVSLNSANVLAADTAHEDSSRFIEFGVEGWR